MLEATDPRQNELLDPHPQIPESSGLHRKVCEWLTFRYIVNGIQWAFVSSTRKNVKFPGKARMQKKLEAPLSKEYIVYTLKRTYVREES